MSEDKYSEAEFPKVILIIIMIISGLGFIVGLLNLFGVI